MRVISLLCATMGLIAGPAALSAQSAAPENPDAFAKVVVVPDAKEGGAGDMVPDTATSAPGALAEAIKGARDALGAAPNPPGED